MLITEFKTIKFDAIDFNDQTFRVSTPAHSAKLEESINQAGLIQPLLVQEMPFNHFRIISGFRRYSVLLKINATEIPVLCYKKNQSEIDLFEIAIQDNSSHRSLNPVEISIILNKLSQQFNVQVNQLMERYLPLLGLGQNKKMIDLYTPLIRLGPEWQNALISGTVSVEMASLVALKSLKERQWLIALINRLNLSKSRQREFWTLFTEIAQIKAAPVFELTDLPAVSVILENDKLTHNQKTERLKNELWKLRYPRYTMTMNKFEKIVKEAKCPPGLCIVPSSYFMDEKFHVSFSFTNENDYELKVAYLENLIHENIVSQLTSLV